MGGNTDNFDEVRLFVKLKLTKKKKREFDKMEEWKLIMGRKKV